ncbi:hypothetical protein A5660_14995 [Mycobacterium alsense]|nr:hypothetical protein A5660_14995 [Mycobacterium alsense]
MRVGLSVERRGLADEIKNDIGRSLIGARTDEAVGAPARAREPVGAGRQRPQRIGAALRDGAGVVVAHRMGHLQLPPIQHGRVGGPTSAAS